MHTINMHYINIQVIFIELSPLKCAMNIIHQLSHSVSKKSSLFDYLNKINTQFTDNKLL